MSGICAQFQSANNQTFITWADLATGATGNNWRYSVYRSTSPITSGNYGSATLIASHVFNNSGQLFGGDPSISGGNAFTQANRQDAGLPMSILAFGGSALPAYSGLQIYTPTGTQSAYYAVVGNPQPSGSDSYIGSFGPVAETAGTVVPIKYADSLSRGVNYGKITAPTGIPVIFNAHPSGSSGGAPGRCINGDYWEWFLPPQDGYQDGRATVLDVLQDNNENWLGEASALVAAPRDTWWTTDGTSGLETFHIGVGMSPNSIVGAANRMYLSTADGYKKFINFVVSNYGADANQLHWSGVSMGAWGGANTGIRMTSPQFAAVWLEYPIFRMDHRSSAGWPGNLWGGTEPFIATVGSAPATMGATASAVLMSDGSTWGGTGGYADVPTFIGGAPGTDLPVVIFSDGKNDPFAAWADELAAMTAFGTAKRGYAFAWSEGAHDTESGGAVDADAGGALATAYHKAVFPLNVSYPAFSNSSIDDDPGTGATVASGLYDGDHSGCKNCGFHWAISTDTSGNYNFTLGNSWMGNAATAAPTTTLTGNIAASGGGTVTVTSGAVFHALGNNQYFLVGNTEVLYVTSVVSDTVTFSSLRGNLNTTAQSHTSGDSIRQLIGEPTGPNAGPQTSMTVDVTPRRRQGFHPSNGATVTCTVTPHGGSPSTISPVVDANGLFTITSFPINSSGDTTATCS